MPSGKITYSHFYGISLLLLVSLQGISQSPRADRGTLDLRGWNWENRPEIALRGEWEFYWKEFVNTDEIEYKSNGLVDYINLPAPWNNHVINGEKLGAKGFATYHLRIFLDDSVKNLAIQTKIVSTAYDLYVNGNKILNGGKIGETRFEAIPEYYPKVASLPQGAVLDIVLHVSNYDHRLGGARDLIFIGQDRKLFRDRGIRLLTDLFLAGCFIMMGLYHLVLFAIKIDRSPLFFSLFCFILTVRLFVTGDMPITSYFNPNWFVLIRAEYLSFYLGGIMFMAFFASLFSSEMNKRIEKGVYFFIGFMSLIVLFAPPIVFTSLLIPGQVIILLMILYFFNVLYKANKHGNKEARIFFVGFFFFNATLINDILFANEIIETGHLFSIGLFIFLGFQSALLSRRYVLAFKRNEDLLKQLNISNRELEEKVKERTQRLEDQKANLETSNLQITTQNDELRKLNSELDNFVYSVSHDLKAPIASMLGLINLSKNEGEIKTLKYYQEMMERSLNRQNEFIGDILDYSRNARLSLRHDKIDFKELVTKTLELYQFIENWKKIKKDLDIVQEVAFITDRQRLNIVLSNVISNALKYSTVNNQSPEIQIKVKANEHEANIVIKDNGCGIDPSRIKNIFEMFYRADEKRSGSGLGLYIVKETLDKLNGKIDIQSTVGKGTTVHIFLPGLTDNQD